MRRLITRHCEEYILTFLSLKYSNIVTLSMLKRIIPRHIKMFCKYCIISEYLYLQYIIHDIFYSQYDKDKL
jgi:hypothetical protein